MWGFWHFDRQEPLDNIDVIVKYKDVEDVGMQGGWCESEQEM